MVVFFDYILLLGIVFGLASGLFLVFKAINLI
jgi:hypothetical protein